MSRVWRSRSGIMDGVCPVPTASKAAIDTWPAELDCCACDPPCSLVTPHKPASSNDHRRWLIRRSRTTPSTAPTPADLGAVDCATRVATLRAQLVEIDARMRVAKSRNSRTKAASSRDQATQMVLADRAVDREAKKRAQAASRAAARKRAEVEDERRREEAEARRLEEQEAERAAAEAVEAARAAAEAEAERAAELARACAEEEATLAASEALEAARAAAAAEAPEATGAVALPAWVKRLIQPEHTRRIAAGRLGAEDGGGDVTDDTAGAVASVLRLGSGDAKLTAAPSAILFPTSKASAVSAGHDHDGGGGGAAAARAGRSRAGGGGEVSGGASSDLARIASGGGASRSTAVRVQLAAWDGAHTPLERVAATTVLVLRDGIALDSQVIGKLPLGGTRRAAPARCCALLEPPLEAAPHISHACE